MIDDFFKYNKEYDILRECCNEIGAEIVDFGWEEFYKHDDTLHITIEKGNLIYKFDGLIDIDSIIFFKNLCLEIKKFYK